MNILLMILVNLAISLYLSSKNKQKRNTISPLAIDNSGVPIADESSNYPLSYGTNEIKQSNCTWYGDYSTFPIYKKIKTEGGFLGIGGGTEKVEAALGYRIGFVMSLGYGEQNLKAIKVEDKLLYTNTIPGSYEGNIDQKSFFGTPDSDGGMAGKFRFYNGADVQAKDTYFAAKVGRDVPNYPNKSYIVFESFYIGNQNSLRNMSYVTERYPHYDFLDFSKRNINGSCNPVNIITDVLMSVKNGASIPVSKIDTESFVIAQNTLYEEEFGLSFVKYDDTTVNEIKNSVSQIIDANILMNRQTGKLKIKLNRQDYDIDTIFELNDDNFMTVKKYSTNSTSECVTEYKLTWTDINDDFKIKVLPFHNEARYSENNQAISKTEDYPAITDERVANMVMLRNVLPLTQQFIKITLTVTKLPNYMDVGDVVALVAPRYKIAKMPMRIAEIDWGDCRDTSITLTLQQDLFAPVLYTNSTNTSYWQPVDYTAHDVDLKLVETPYALTSDGSTSTGKNEIMAMAKNINNSMIGYNLYSNLNVLAGGATGFTPQSSLLSSIGKHDNIIVLNNDPSLSVVTSETETNLRRGYNVAIITEGSKIEFIAFGVIASGILSAVRRGLFDTIPQSFSSAAEVRFYTYGFAQTTSITYDTGVTAQLKAQTRTVKEELDLASATVKSLSVIGKNSKPIVVNNLKVNTQNFADSVNIGLTDLLSLTYSFRNKQKSFVQFYTEAATNDDNNDVVITIYNNLTNTLIKQETTTLDNFVFSDEATYNAGVLFSQLRVEIKTVKASVESIYKYNIIVNRT